MAAQASGGAGHQCDGHAGRPDDQAPRHGRSQGGATGERGQVGAGRHDVRDRGRVALPGDQLSRIGQRGLDQLAEVGARGDVLLLETGCPERDRRSDHERHGHRQRDDQSGGGGEQARDQQGAGRDEGRRPQRQPDPHALVDERVDVVDE